jgi:hypothetical protein
MVVLFSANIEYRMGLLKKHSDAAFPIFSKQKNGYLPIDRKPALINPTPISE